MAATLIYDDRASTVNAAIAEGDNLWLRLSDLRSATGWELKPQGLCRDELCVPIPAARHDEFVRSGEFVNLCSLAGQLGQQVVHDDSHSVWFFSESVDSRRDALASLKAPDFTLPDLDGKPHSLSNYIGRKILLLSWASW
jgi:hypothetical protein